MNYQEILLRNIRPNPRNPRKTYKGRSFDELAESIRAKGVIQPIVVRPIEPHQEGKTVEIVAGNRRFKALCSIIEEHDLMDKATIPAVVRDLTEDEAFELMMIENLQREDLTDLEEAMSFKAFIHNFKDRGAALQDLAKKTGINPRYIRSRLDVLRLPKYVLKEWNKGTFIFGHLEQLLRVKDSKDFRKVFEWTLEGMDDEPEPVRALKEKIDGGSPELKYATFPRDECKTCTKNSSVQLVMWDLEEGKEVFCHEPKCFREKQEKYLKKNWKKTEFFKNYKTIGFRFKEEIGWNSYVTFREYEGALRPDKDCFECSNFVTLLTTLGKVDEKQACIDVKCKSRKQRAWDNRGKPEKAKGTGPRVAWHGEFFREEFLAGRIPEKFTEHKPLEDEDTIRLTMFGFVSTGHHFKSLLSDSLKEAGKLKDRFSLFYREGNVRLWRLITKMKIEEVKTWLVKFAEDIIMNRQEVSADARLKIAEFLGVKLLKEFAVTEEYLKKKTIKEMLEFGKKSKLFTDPLVMKYLRDKIKKKGFDKCKKTELLDVFLKSGAKLIGKIPAEIVPPKEAK